MHDGWTKLISNVQPPIVANSHGFDGSSVRNFLRRNAWRNFRIESDLRLSRRKDRERLESNNFGKAVSLYALRSSLRSAATS